MPRWAVRRYCDTRGLSTRPDCTMYQPSAPCNAPSPNITANFHVSARAILPRSANHRSGSRNAAPISLPRSRWTYSHQKMPLKPSRFIPGLTSRYSGVCLYFPKVSCHPTSSSGGRAPTIGRHSTMESPEWVSRVTPPTTTIANTSAQQASGDGALAASRLRLRRGRGRRLRIRHASHSIARIFHPVEDALEACDRGFRHWMLCGTWVKVRGPGASPGSPRWLHPQQEAGHVCDRVQVGWRSDLRPDARGLARPGRRLELGKRS